MSLCAFFKKYLHTPTAVVCHYPPAFLQKYLRILRRFLRWILRWFQLQFLRGFIATCAVASQSHLLLIAVASPHRIGAASRRCKKRRRRADFIRTTFASGGAADASHAD
jgi:hypothetical protein